jgi:hypothetical protein
MNKADAVATRLDPQSRTVLRRFAFLLIFFMAWSAIIGLRNPLPVFVVMTLTAAVVETGMAAYRREKIAASSLGRWDLAAALVGMHCLARTFA